MVRRIRIGKRSVDQLAPESRRYTAWDVDLPGFGVKVLPSGRMSYIFRYRAGGGRDGEIREPRIGGHGELTPDEARTIAKLWAADVAGGGDPSAMRAEARQAPTMGDLFDRYISDHALPHKKPSSVAEDLRLIRIFLHPTFSARKIREVSRGEVDRFHKSLAAKPYRANRSIALLSKAFNLAEVWGWRTDGTNPCRHVRKFAEKRRERFLSEEELARLGAALMQAESRDLVGPKGPISPFAIAAIRLLIFTGARKGEILGLRWSWIQWEHSRVDLPDSKTGRKFLYLAPPAVAVLKSLPRLSDNPHVIAGSRSGGPLVQLQEPWGAIREAAGLSDVRLHDLRHSFASVGAAAGMSLPLLGSLLGHREATTTARYAHLSDDPQRAAAALISDQIRAALEAGTGPSSDLPGSANRSTK